jgi:hypothetical protein
VQIFLSTLHTDLGLDYKDACDLIETNKEQLEKYGSNTHVRDVGFYIRKQPVNKLETGNDIITLVTGRIRHSGEGKHSNAQVTQRHPWSASGKSICFANFRMHWKLCKNEKMAQYLWEFWYKYEPQVP